MKTFNLIVSQNGCSFTRTVNKELIIFNILFAILTQDVMFWFSQVLMIVYLFTPFFNSFPLLDSAYGAEIARLNVSFLKRF